jgi:hypothetical protein
MSSSPIVSPSSAGRIQRGWRYAARVPAAALSLLVLVACTDQSPTGLSPKRVSGVARSVTGGSGRPTLFKNAIKYRDQGKKPATGRSGSSSLTARALLGKDGVATLDITTGEIDAITAPGLLKKIQLKQFDPSGNLQSTSNWKDIGAPRTQMLIPGRARGSNLQLQANVVGVDPNRTDVVTITESVKLRPDLSVNSVEAPAQATVGTPVTINAIVSEQNGDVGAHADCVLSVDGTEDHANGIWVDAGRTVSCAFMKTFTTLGTKTLSVSVVGVSPGDWDAANNAASASIQIAPPPSTNDFTWFAAFNGVADYRRTDRDNGYWYYANSNRGEWSYQHEFTRYDNRSIGTSGTAVGSIGVPSEVHFVEQLDGTTIHELSFDPQADAVQEIDNSWTNSDGSTVHETIACIYIYQTAPVMSSTGVPGDATVAAVSTCSVQYTGDGSAVPASVTVFSSSSYATDVSYYSNEYSRSVWNGVESVYSLNGPTDFAYGQLVFGTHYSFSFRVAGTDGAKNATGSLSVTSQPSQYSQPYTCQDFTGNDGFFEHQCSGVELTYTFYSGSAAGQPDN